MLNYLARLRVSTKLTACFGVMLLALAWTGWQGLRSAQSTKTSLEANAEAARLAGELELTRAKIGIAIRDAIILVDPTKMRAAQELAETRNQKFRKELADFEPHLTLAESKRAIDEVKPLYESYWADLREAAEASPSGDSAGDPPRMFRALDKAVTTARELDAKVSLAIDAEEKAGRAGAEAQFDGNRLTVLVSSAVAIGFALIALAYVKRSVTGPLEEVSLAASAIARGDTRHQVTFHSHDEIGVLADSMRGVLDFVGGVAKAAQAMARGDLNVEVKKRSDADVLSASVMDATRSLRTLVERARTATEAAQKGELDVRGDATGLDGAYGELVRGLNATMDAFSTPMSELKAVLAAMAERDLSARMTGNYQGDYVTIKDALDQALTNMEGTLESVVSSAQQVATAATEISSGSQSLSQAATEQASSLEEVTSSLQEITAMSKQNAGSAQQARGMAQSAAEGAAGGGRSMAKLSEAVATIKQHADETAKIVKTIDDIAFQTNLLALNAAVEAARAGDAGKGFAVVAEEVRNLAMRCAEAAKSTSHLIEESVKSSELGVQLNAEASQHFTGITEKVGRIVEVIGEIAAASEHQSRGVSQINTAVDEMSRVTQHNAATTEESAAACEELSSQASSMQEMVGSFQLSTGGRVAPVARKASSPRRPPALPVTKARPTHLRSVPPPRVTAKTGTDAESLFPLDADDDLEGLQQF